MGHPQLGEFFTSQWGLIFNKGVTPTTGLNVWWWAQLPRRLECVKAINDLFLLIEIFLHECTLERKT